MIKRALISVYDKSGLEELANSLAQMGCEIVAGGDTAETIKSFGVAVTGLEEVTKTRAPTIFASCRQATATPPPMPTISTVSPGRSVFLPNSIRQAVR